MNLTRSEARERAELINVESYDVNLDLTRGDEVFGSTTVVRFSAQQGASTFIDAVTAAVHRITLNGVSLDPAEVSDGVRISLPNLAESNELVVEADALYMNTGEGLHRFVDPVDNEVYLYSQFEVPDSRRMFAVFEQPDLKATFRFTVTAPSHWDVISNSPTPEPVAAGDLNDASPRSTWSFEPTPRISSYITALIAGPYQSVRSELTSSDGRTIPLGVFARRSLMQFMDAENIFELTRQGFAFYEEQFGTPYPFEKYDQLFVPEFNAGAMENAGAVTFLESYVFRSRVTDATVERRAVTILHELAHMWFGDLVTMRWWNDLWLNESFAEFMSTLAAAEATEFKQAWTTFASLEKAWAYRQDQLPTTHPIVAEIRDLEDVQVNFDGITYAKGASVLKQLVAWVGQDKFMAGVREYFGKHAWHNTELADLLSELETASGRDLKEWSAQWLETAGVNTLRPEIETDGDGTITSFAVLQSAIEEYPTLRPHRLAIGFYNPDEDGRLQRTHRVELDVDGGRTEVPDLAGQPRPALVLLNDDDLAYAKIRLDDASQHTATRNLRNIADSLPRTLVWASAWDAARDAEIPARNYVELVLQNIASESDSTVVQVLLRQLATTLAFYVSPADREPMMVAAADSLWELASAAEPGSDSQLQFVKAFAAHASSGAQLDTLAALFAGSQSLEGLSIDADLRWELLTGLVAGGRMGAEDIDAELERDATATGALAGAMARAALPTAEAKAAAWEAIVERSDMPNAAQRSAIAGFMRVHDAQLLEPYADKYFASIRDVWASRTHEIAQQIAVGLYPSRLTRRETVEATDSFLADLGADSPSLRRLILENRDGVVRALKAQDADR
ncbi:MULTISPECIES: aminopeptidase N [unclassified Arthrobacter]|uniref:aminopeptidase N n=1 Tax=unclassified Arthrobacter TaxID=235627 RepID=UPI001E3C1C15|nr:MULTISPECIES: aminopeptidase N [unclassified Arthrobacter]MCC9145661.1 aminopeptidase N [Arthrobacter sp. zg-Y919]MDK1276890.1 aminopeptidase N [Arthrobacter sp. zg.Y919]WIB04517.1 aminopeptidase N [Arthrobacter sp. zg-Y919]